MGGSLGDKTGRAYKIRYGGLETLGSISTCAEISVNGKIEMFIPNEGSTILFAKYLLLICL